MSLKTISDNRKTAFLAILMSLCMILTGCAGKSVEEGENPKEISDDAIIIKDLAGKEHIFNEPLNKAAIEWSCAGGPFMTMSAILGDEIAEHIACMDDSPEKYRADVWEQCIKDVPELANIKKVGSADREINLEGILSSGAEAFICPLELKKVMDESLAGKLESVDIPVIYVDFHSETIENHKNSTLLLGKLFGKEERAEEIVRFYEEKRNSVTDRLEEILKTKERPRIYIEVGMLGPSEFGNSFDNSYSWGGIAYQSGGDSIGEGVVSNLGPLDSEYILSCDPDKIVLTGSSGTAVPDAVNMGYKAEKEETKEHMKAFFNRPGWKELKAFRNGEVYAINHGLAREMYDCACLQFFAKVCFPEEFEDISPEETLKEYFDLFMPYSLEGTWFVL